MQVQPTPSPNELLSGNTDLTTLEIAGGACHLPEFLAEKPHDQTIWSRKRDEKADSADLW